MLLDTSGLLCLLHAGETQHRRALSLFDAASIRVTHTYILAEFIALAHVRGIPRQETLAFISDLQDSPEVTVIYIDQTVHRAALSLLHERLDKDWSLCDAVSFILMQQLGLPEALTTDRHFQQAGFVRLLTP